MQQSIIFQKVYKIYHIPSIIPWKKGEKIEALKNVSFSCPKGKITCLLGPNGAGKTTIIKILANLVSHDSGEIIINGGAINEASRYPASNIGVMTSNERSFYWRLTGRQNLDFFCSLHNLAKKERRETVSQILSELEIEQEADKPFRLYSSGNKQKFLLARALLCKPDILLLDEPTTHIDPIATENIHNLIINNFVRKRKATILLCTHDLYEARELADNIVLLNQGTVIAEGGLPRLKSMIRPGIRFVMDFTVKPKTGWNRALSAEIVSESKRGVEFTVKNRKIIPGIVTAAVRHGGEISGCREIEETVHEIFSRLTAGAAK